MARLKSRVAPPSPVELRLFGRDPEALHEAARTVMRVLRTIPGAEDVTSRLRGSERVVQVDGCKFVLPTIIWCEDPGHPLAKAELLFPFASVVQVPQSEMLERIGPTLVGTALSDDETFIRELLSARNVDRLNLGEFPSSRISWDQPHEGNLFEHLYRQRAFQIRPPGSAA